MLYWSMPKTKTSENYDFFLKADTSKYKGEWIAIADRKIVAHGERADRVLKEAKKKVKDSEVSIAKIPEHDVVVY